MTTFVLVSCTKGKRDDAAHPGDLYDTSDYFRKQRRYARANTPDDADAWFILSAGHALLVPDGDPIDPYNWRMKDVRAGDVPGFDDEDDWAEQVADTFAQVADPARGGTVIFTAGMDYSDPLIPELEHRFGVDCLEPFRGQGIGTRKRTIPEAAREAENRGLDTFGGC